MLRGLSIFGVAWLGIIGYQAWAGAYGDDFYYEDTAGHFVTGVMVADYVRTAAGSDPTAFAEEYYLRAPKVAFGRWPPLFHVLQGAWYLAFGASKASALALMAAIGAAAAACLFGRLSRLYGPGVAALAAIPIAAQPIMRWQVRNIMSDVLTMLLCMLAAFALADFLATRRVAKLAASAAWCVLAAMTKENAWYLLAFVPLAIVTNGGWSMRRDARVWAGVAAMAGAVVGIAAYRLWVGFGLHGYQGVEELATRMMRFNAVGDLLTALVGVAEPLMFVVAGAGWLAAFRSGASPEVRLHARLAAAWIVAMLLFFWAAPAPPQARYFMPALVPLALLAGSALRACREIFAGPSPAAARLAPWIVCLTLTLFAAQPTLAGVRGYRAAAEAIPRAENQVTLISADSFGEGAFVVERLMTDRDRRGIVLRGSKALSDSDWLGTDFQLLAPTANDVFRYLCETPVHYIVVDATSAPGEAETPDRPLLRQTIGEHPEAFELIGAFALTRGTNEFAEAVEVYRNVEAARRRADVVRIDLRHTLGRVLEFRLRRPSPAEDATP
jgi:hypothetical protein